MTVTRTRAPLRERMTAASAPLNRVFDRDEDRAGGEEAERRHDPLGAVAAPDRHAIARLDPALDQGGAERPRRIGQLRVARGRRPTRRARPPGRRTAPPRCRAWPGWRARRRRRCPAGSPPATTPGRRRPLRMVLFPYNNVTFDGDPTRRWGLARSPEPHRGRRHGHNCARAVLRPLRLRHRRRPLPGLEAAARRGAALLQREVRLLRHQPVRRRGARPRSSGRPTARPRARCSRSSRRRWRCRPACSSSRTRPTTTSTAAS